MELLFTWIKDYRNIQNQGINFSAEFEITFEEDASMLSISTNKHYIANFFGEMISNVSVIVGENGTGKSSILSLNSVTFALMRNEDKFILFQSDDTIIACNFDVYKTYKIYLQNVSFIKYSNFLNNYIEIPINGLFPTYCFTDISTNKEVQSIINFNEDDLNSSLLTSTDKPSARMVHMHVSEILKQMSFILKDNNHTLLKFKTPERLSIIFNIDNEINYLKKLSKQDIDKYSENAKIMNEFFRHLTAFAGSDFSNIKYSLFLLRWSIILSYINSFSYPNFGNKIAHELLPFKDDNSLKPIDEWFEDFFKNSGYLDKNSFYNPFNNYPQKWLNVAKFVKEFEELIESEDVNFDFPNIIPSFNNDTPSVMQIIISFNLKDFEKNLLYQTLVLNYESVCEPMFVYNKNIYRPFLTFQWRGLSSGEIAMLRIFSRINLVKDDIIKARKREYSLINLGQELSHHLIFLIDEGEIGLHPTWQQQFLNTLIENLPRMFKDEGVKSIQLVLATHSPFILSDVPNNHVIFLEKDTNGKCKVIKNPLHDKKMTFGANIHSLLSDGFFMKDGLMGDFAKKKINQLIDDLLEKGNQLSPERKAEIQKMIPLIGEPIIRKKVMDLYNEQINLNIDDRIKQLEESRKQLEKDIQMLKEAKRDDSNKKK